MYLFGLTVHVFMLALTVLLPGSIAMTTLQRIAVPVIVVYPAGVRGARAPDGGPETPPPVGTGLA